MAAADAEPLPPLASMEVLIDDPDATAAAADAGADAGAADARGGDGLAALDGSGEGYLNTDTQLAPEPEPPQDEWVKFLNVDDILKRKTVQNPYITACKLLGVVPVARFTECMATASEIRLKSYGLGPKGAQAIAFVLEGNNTLTSLDLSDNLIESGGAFIGRSLQINHALVSLDLANNRLGLQAGTELAEMLGFNSCLRSLNLS
ncbi:hypothetical protein HK405_002274, partial [Cladochytrium tenue]